MITWVWNRTKWELESCPNPPGPDTPCMICGAFCILLALAFLADLVLVGAAMISPLRLTR